MNSSIKSIKTYKSPITGKVYTKTVYKGTPGLVASKITSEKPKEEVSDNKDSKNYREELDKKIKKGVPFLPGPAGTSPNHSRRYTYGGGLIRLKRK